MSIAEKFKALGGVMIGVAVFGAFGLLIVAYIEGGAWLTEKVFPWVGYVFWCTVAVCVLLLVPLALVRPTRPFAGAALLIASWVFGFMLWVLSFVATLVLWGVVGVVVGLLFAGIGVVPIAVLATLLNGEWTQFFNILLLIAATWGARIGAFVAISKVSDGDTIDA